MSNMNNILYLCKVSECPYADFYICFFRQWEMMPKIQRCLKDKMLEHKDHLPVLQLREAAALSGCHSHILSRQYPETHEEEEEEAG